MTAPTAPETLLLAAGTAETLGLRYDLEEDSITVFFTPVKSLSKELMGPPFTPYLLSADGLSWYVGADRGGDGPETQSKRPMVVPDLFRSVRGMIEYAHLPHSVAKEIQQFLVHLYLPKIVK
jgi:hypothetical protein